MKLQNKLLRHFISAGVVVLTSSFLVYELVASHRDMSEYMRYIVEKGESAFLYDKYQNQLVISQVSRKLDTHPTAEKAQQACAGVQTNGNVYGLNIAGHTFPGLHGTLSTTQPSCEPWINDLPALQAFDAAIAQSDIIAALNSATFKSDKRFRYYLDLDNKYAYFYSPIEIDSSPVDNWNFLHDSKLGITQFSLNGLLRGRTLISSIYADALTGQNILSFLTPV